MATLCCGGALAWFSAHGYTLYYGDAAAHLNVARRVVDSRTPGYDQIGTVWLPIPHVAMMPLVNTDTWWRDGLAGAIPAAIANLGASLGLFLLVRHLAGSTGGWTAMLCYLANPNLMYLGSIPMTEPFFLCALFGMLYAGSRADSVGWAAVAGVFACAGTLIRYEGWFVLPFVALYIGRRSPVGAVVFSLIAGLGPAYWLLHNLYLEGDPLAFYRGPYSAKAIYQRAIDAHMARSPGDHDWVTAFRYFGAAARLVAGWPLMIAGLVGAFLMARRRLGAEVALLTLPPLFYIWGMHSSGNPIFMPHLYPFSYYNTRYGLAAMPLLLCGAGMLGGISRVLPPLLVAGSLASGNWICWRESQVNSESRRAWTEQAAIYLRENYRGGGIATGFGDLAGVYQQAGIPLAETVNECNSPHWMALVARPDLFLREEWAVTIAGDPVDSAVAKARSRGPLYDLVHTIQVKGAPDVRIYRFRSRLGLRVPTEEELEKSQIAWEEAEVR